MNDIVLRLLNGCDSIEAFQTKENWGPHEIHLGLLSGFIFTYGSIRLFDNGEEIGELEMHDENTLVHYNGKYYGDFEIITNDNIILGGAVASGTTLTKVNPVHLESFESYKKKFQKIALDQYSMDENEFDDEGLHNFGYSEGKTPQELMSGIAERFDLDPIS